MFRHVQQRSQEVDVETLARDRSVFIMKFYSELDTLTHSNLFPPAPSPSS